MAAPAKKEKKIVNQQELRRLMREKQRAAAGSKRIESPLAKYPFAEGNLEKRKATKQTTGPSFAHTSTVPVGKRKVIDAESQATKKAKVFCESRTPTDSGLPADFIDPENNVSQQAISAQCSGLSLVVGDYEEDGNDIEEEDKKSAVADSSVAVAPLQKNAALPAPVQAETGHSLPADFFDSTLASSAPPHSGSIQKPKQSATTVERKGNTAEALPEGFFDDPVKDAKVRKVDPPKDQMDKEWEEFQKEIRQVNTVSEAIVAEDDEEVRLDRQIEEIDEQIMCYRRIEHLRDRQETVKLLMTALKGRQSHGEDDVGTDEEEEFQEFLSGDWRAKGALL
ncbi:zinc finger protein 830 isoform X2 [Mustelus asterias]